VRLESLVGGAPEVVGPETPIADVATLMVATGRDAVAVVDRTGLIGICTARDVVRAAASGVDPGAAVVADWMTEAPDTVGPEVPVDEASLWLLEAGYRHLPVMDGDELLGIVDIRDLLWALTNP
jgi:CBS domain-containing protein